MARFNLSLRNWRLRTTLIVSVVLLFGVLASTTLFTYRAMLVERRAGEVDNALIVARNLAAQVDRLMADIEGTTFTAALFLGSQPRLDHEATYPYLRALLDQYDILRSVFITDLSGTVIASGAGEGVGLSLASRPYITALAGGARTVWSDGLIGIRSGEVTVAFGRPIYGPDGTARALLLAAFYPLRVTARLQATLPRDAAVWLFDRRGFILSSTYPVRLTAEQRGLPPVPGIREALGGNPVRFVGRPLPFFQEDRYGAFVPIPRAHWALSYGRPLAPLQAQLEQLLLRQMAAITAAVLFGLLLFALVLRRLMRPLEVLARASAAIARGERPRVEAGPGPVETREVAAGMRAMVDAVAQREDELRGALVSEQEAREASEQARMRLSFLTEASTLLASSLDYEETLRNVARLAVPHFADWAAVDILDEDGRLQRLAVAHVDPEKVRLAFELQQRYPTDPNEPRGIHEVLRTGKPEFYPEIPDEMIRAAARDEEHLRLIRAVGGLRSAIIVPIIIRDQAVGALSFVWGESARTYSPEDVGLAQDLARRAGAAIDNARLYRRERNIAETLQRSLLQKRLPDLPGIAIAARYLPARMEAEVGGDWYDVFTLPDGRLGLVMGDVAGRGVQAAAVMGQLQNALRAYAMEGHSPAVIMERLNRAVELQEMATVLYLIFDPARWTIQYANAGHLPPIVLGPDRSVQVLEDGSPPLGGPFGATYHEDTRTVPPGSTILMYTDGLVEVRGESIDEGLRRLTAAAAEPRNGDPETLLDHLVGRLIGDAPSPDDVALLALRAEALDPAALRVRMPAVPQSLPQLRHTLRRWLTQSAVPDDEIFEITVAVSEAFGNAVEHAYAAADGTIEVDARRANGELILHVRDWGQWRAPRGANRGRGLGLMRGLMDDITVTPGAAGTIVRMRRRLRGEVRA